MNNNFNKKKEHSSTGKYLKETREQIGLTKKDVAKYLCLKLSTINDIENDQLTEKISLTFLNGYIRSYAHLLNLPEKKIKENI